MWKSGVLTVALAAVFVGTAEAAPVCDVDLTLKGMPVCEQACAMWCWATVIGEFQDFYKHKNREMFMFGDPISPECRQDECLVVSNVTGHNCCGTDPTRTDPEGCHEGTDPCGPGLAVENITLALQHLVPEEKWVSTEGPPSENDLVALLMSGNPVGRVIPDHIDAVVGCRPGKNGTEYRVIDSLQPESMVMWYPYEFWLSPMKVYQGTWINSIFAKPKGLTLEMDRTEIPSVAFA